MQASREFAHRIEKDNNMDKRIYHALGNPRSIIVENGQAKEVFPNGETVRVNFVKMTPAIHNKEYDLRDYSNKVYPASERGFFLDIETKKVYVIEYLVNHIAYI